MSPTQQFPNTFPFAGNGRGVVESRHKGWVIPSTLQENAPKDNGVVGEIDRYSTATTNGFSLCCRVTHPCTSHSSAWPSATIFDSVVAESSGVICCTGHSLSAPSIRVKAGHAVVNFTPCFVLAERSYYGVGEIDPIESIEARESTRRNARATRYNGDSRGGVNTFYISETGDAAQGADSPESTTQYLCAGAQKCCDEQSGVTAGRDRHQFSGDRSMVERCKDDGSIPSLPTNFTAERSTDLRAIGGTAVSTTNSDGCGARSETNSDVKPSSRNQSALCDLLTKI